MRFYETGGVLFWAVYEKITAEVLRLAQERAYVVYAVPGHPFVAEEAAVRIAVQAAEMGLKCTGGGRVEFFGADFFCFEGGPLP